MKKKYFAPEMEELEIDEPVVLSEDPSEGGETGLCTTGYTCEHSGGYD